MGRTDHCVSLGRPLSLSARFFIGEHFFLNIGGTRRIACIDSGMQVDAYIAMGSNLGHRQNNILGGLDAIAELDTTGIVQCSTIIETDPIGPGDQDSYLNGVVHITTSLVPRELLAALMVIETSFGRDRSEGVRWGARTLDLDILIYGDRIIDEHGLVIPHPRLHTRGFVLIPLYEIAPEIMLPRYEKTPQELLEVLERED